ncbi:MAG TPA: LysR family transcriptional regulator [Azospira sp.]|nr:LysR family transcriptional regulator [Azospira sp.]
MDKLLAMEVFVRIVETGGITRAADSLRMPKSTVATLLQKLEGHLGVKLLNRTTRSVALTPDGALYYRSCQDILAQVVESEESVARRNATARGRLRVDVPTLMARLVIVPALPAFFARYPDIQLELSSNERQANLVEDGIDCAVWSGELPDSGLVARPIGQLYFATCAAPAYLAEHGHPQHPDDLGRHRCINRFSPRSGELAGWVFAKDGTRLQATLPGHVAVDDENSYVAAAEAGLGIARMPAFVAKEAIEAGRLELVLGDWFPEPAPLYVVYPRNRHLSNKVRVFVDWITGLFREHDGIQLRSTVPRGHQLKGGDEG